MDEKEAAAEPPLPCLNSNIGNGGKPALTGSHSRVAFALASNVRAYVDEKGLETVGFLTLTFADHVTDIREAQRRFKSLRTGALSERYPGGFIGVPERMKSGRLHFHLLVSVGRDIWTGFDWSAIERQDYRSANAALRSEWAYWRTTAKAYRFGRTELLPIRSSRDAIAAYVGKYIAKHIGQRQEADKGAKLVLYGGDTRRTSARFGWNSPRSWLWRRKLATFAAGFGVEDLAGMSERFGKRWAFVLVDAICSTEIACPYPTKSHAVADGHEVWDLPEEATEIEL